MAIFLGLNRRSGRDRRVNDTESPSEESRHRERRRFGTDRYVVVMGDGGIDRFGLIVGLPVALLIGAAVLSTFVKV